MSWKLVPAFFVIAGIAIYFYASSFRNTDTKLSLPEKQYFGKGEEHKDDTAVRKFKINVAEVVLEDLKNRLKNFRIGHEQLEDVPDFEYGFNVKILEKFRHHWLNNYDWRKYEEILNAFPQFTTEIEGLKIHFLHVKPPPNKYSKVIPLILVHGWPGNVFEFYKIIPMLTDPSRYLADLKHADFAFEVIVPSIPGYGWSEQPHKRGFSQVASARIFHNLMTERLNFSKYLAQGGDWGSLNVIHMSRMFPEYLYGVHTNTIFLKMNSVRNIFYIMFGSVFPSLMYSNLEAASKWSFTQTFLDLLREGGYFHIQATKPDTAGVALNDSPVGLMAYILEKFSSWTNPNFRFRNDGGLETKYTMDELLTIVTIYWVNGNILSSQRYYREFFLDENNQKFDNKYVDVPTGILAPPYDLMLPPPYELVNWRYNITHYTKLEDGGHFTAFELPREVATDIFKFVKSLNI